MRTTIEVDFLQLSSLLVPTSIREVRRLHRSLAGDPHEIFGPIMSKRYFATTRTEIFPHLPQNFNRLLDVGCGAGSTIAAIREMRGEGASFWAGGVELDEASATKADQHCDRVWRGDVEAGAFDADIEAGTLDVVLCLDVLEHLADPWTMVKRLSPLLAPGGSLIISIPNIRNWKFIWRLFANADFHYRDAGLLDRIHLRFFVRKTAIELAESGGLSLHHVGSTRPFEAPDIRWFLVKATFGGLEDLMIKQFVLVAKKTD